MLENYCRPFLLLRMGVIMEDDEHEPDTAKRLHRVQQLHVLNILRDSDQFSWAVKSGTFSVVDALSVTNCNFF
jgi:hypothetical protein